MSDEVSLLAHPVLKVKDPDYIEGLDVGNRDYKIIKTEGYYFAFGHELMEIIDRSGKNIKALETHYPGLRTFIKSNKLSFKNRPDLILITNHLISVDSQESSI